MFISVTSIITIFLLLLAITYTELRLLLPVYIFCICIKLKHYIPEYYWVVILSLVIIYWKNFQFFYYLASVPKFALHRNADNTAIQKLVQKMFSNIFNLKISGNIPDEPTIYVANYPCNFIECFTSVLIPQDIAVVMGDNIMTRSTWSLVLSDVIYRKKKYGKSYKDVKKQIIKKIQKGKSVLGYVTTHSLKGNKAIYLGRVRTGLFRIAKELDIKITPIVFDTIDHQYGRILQQNYQIKICDSFKVKDVNKYVLRVKKIYTETLRKFKNEKY